MENELKRSIIAGIISSLVAQFLMFIISEALKSILGIPFDWLQFFQIQFPLWLVLLFSSIVALTFAFSLRSRERKNILDFEYGRRIAELCRTPSTTEYLRSKYEEWRSGIIAFPSYHFEDYMKQLERQGYLKYRNGKWVVTDKAIEYIEKYHGDSLT
jgi:hypothetical protein